MSKEGECFDYVAALKKQPQLTAPRPTFGPSPRHRQRVVTSAQAPNKQLASIYGKRDSVTESMKCATSKSSSGSSKSNKSRWSNFAKTPSPPRETPNFIKARTTLQQSAKTSEIDLQTGSREVSKSSVLRTTLQTTLQQSAKTSEIDLQTGSREASKASVPVTAMKQPAPNNRLFQTPSQTINAEFMTEEKTVPESCDTSTKIQKLKRTGLYDKIRSLTCKLQIDEDEEDQSTDMGLRTSSETRSRTSEIVPRTSSESRLRTSSESRLRTSSETESSTSEIGAVGGRGGDRNGEDGRESEGSSGGELENDSNVPNKFLVNDSIMIIKETFSAKKKMMQLGMLPVPRSNQMYQHSPRTSPEPPSLKQQSLFKYFNKVDSNETKASTSASDLRSGRDGTGTYQSGNGTYQSGNRTYQSGNGINQSGNGTYQSSTGTGQNGTGTGQSSTGTGQNGTGTGQSSTGTGQNGTGTGQSSTGTQEQSGRSNSQETVRRKLYSHKSPIRSKSETSVYEVSIPVNALQTSVARMAIDDSVVSQSMAAIPPQSVCTPQPVANVSKSADVSKSTQKKIMSASVSNLHHSNQNVPSLRVQQAGGNESNPKIKSSSCSSVTSDRECKKWNSVSEDRKGNNVSEDRKGKNVSEDRKGKSVSEDRKGNSDDCTSRQDLKKLRIRGKVYFLLSLLGQGGSGKVYQVYDPLTQRNLAVKVVDLMKADASTRAGYENEINLLQKLSKCKRVVQLIDYERIRSSDGQVKRLFLIMEKGDADLSNVLKQFIEKESKYQLDPHLVKHYWKEMVKAVDEIHSLDVVHSDLKPVNFITVSGRLKLIDFGIANAIESDATSVIKDNQIGTINYMAPESLQSRNDIDPNRYKVGSSSNNFPPGFGHGSSSKSSVNGSSSKGSVNGSKSFIKYNCKADIWSLGCILYNLVYGKPPFGHLPSLVAKVQAICNPNFSISFPPIDDADLIDCLRKCLERDPRKRPTAKQLLEHPYLTRIIPSIDPTSANQTRSTTNDLRTGSNNHNPSSGFETPEPPSVRSIASQINSLTPNRYNELSRFLQNLSKK